ncbi:MAG: DUF4389 domain-containing protein, partial [Gaiellaceae bacterium]
TYRPSSGSSAPAEPGGESFWAVSASGAGTQNVQWDVAEDSWSVVVMNADASRGVDFGLSLGAKIGFVFWVGLGFVIGGAILLAGGAALLYLGLRRRATAAAPAVASA